MDNCIRCGKAGAENYIADYDAYLCDSCFIEFNKGLERYRKEFIQPNKRTPRVPPCSSCLHYSKGYLDYPCSWCNSEHNLWEDEDECV